MNNLPGIVKQFAPEAIVNSIEPYGSGHINDSYLVKTGLDSAPDYILQRINHKIFRDVPQLTDNILKVTRHIRERLGPDTTLYPDFQVFQLNRSITGRYFHQDDEGQYWRLIGYIAGSRSYDRIDNGDLASEAGNAYGKFQALTSDLDARDLFEVLPRFHDITRRLENFRTAVAGNPAGRAGTCKPEISFIEDRAEEMHHIHRMGESGEIPLRVTHNDTKINNVLFDYHNKAISVVDLDTVMPGYVLYDFGDAIRTGACTGAEDEADLQLVKLDMALFEAYSSGYLRVARGFLTPAEIESLAFSAKFMTYIIGLRFLTDHLDGDQYFKIHFPGHNLRRARTQFKLLQSMEAQFPEMQKIIRKVAGAC